MTVNLSALAGAGQQFFDNNGNPLSGGKLYSYVAGTTTPQATYTSVSGATAHTNPIILDSAGRVATGEIWLTAGQNYKFVLKTSAEVTIATWDNITGINGTGIATAAEYVSFTGFKSQVGTVADLADDDGSDWIGFEPVGSGAVARSAQDKLRETISVKDFGVVGNGVTDDVVELNAAMVAAATANLPLDLNGLDVAFSGDVTVPTSPALRGMVNGTLRALTSGGKIIFGAISLAQYENLVVEAAIEDRGLRDSKFTRVYAKLGWLASATSRDILYNHYDTCEFGFRLTSGVSFNIAVPTSPNNPFSANQFTACKFRSNVGLIALDTTSSTGRVRGNVFSSCDMSGSDVIIKAGSTFSGNCFIGGYYELGGDLDFSASDNGNSFFGGRMDDSRVLGIENFTHFEGSSIGRSTFAHTSLNGVNFAPSRPRVTAGGNLIGWSTTGANTGIANDAAAPAGFSGSNALKLTTLGLAGGKGIFFQVPSSEHKGSLVSIAARVYVPSTYAAGFNPTLAVGDSTGIVLEQNILQRNEWVTVSMSVTPVLADYINCFVYLSRLNHSLTNEMYVDWISVTNGGIVSLYQSAVDDHHTQGDTLQHYGDFQLDESAWDQSRLRLGAYYLWVDATGDLRIKSGAPTSDTDGTIVGTQS